MSSTKHGADWTPSLHPSNPYNYPPEMIQASRLEPKHTPTHIFFFGYENDTHSDPIVGLQQWYPAPFTSDKDGGGIEFVTTEHYMMYHKALLMGDVETAERIRTAPHPSDAKALGRLVRGFDREKWNREADRVVEEGNWLKFSQHAELRELLLGTGNKILVEASPTDRIWGIGFNSEDAIEHQSEWGTNRLGMVLMKVRDRLRSAQKVTSLST